MKIKLLRSLFAVLLLGAVGLSLSACSASLPQKAAEPATIKSLRAWPFESFDTITSTYVDGEGRVDYAALKAHRGPLDEYVGLLAVAGPRTESRMFADDEARFAYYINAYNAVVMTNVLQRYPALENLEPIINDFFYFTEFALDGEETDLYNLENSLIRPFAKRMYEAKGQGSKTGRLHFALNCASSSCPKLPADAFVPMRLEEQLDRETRRFVTETRNVEVQADKKLVRLSSIFQWYAEDFTDDKGKVISPLLWINLYRPESDQIDTSYKVEYIPYDWALNDKDLKR